MLAPNARTPFAADQVRAAWVRAADALRPPPLITLGECLEEHLIDAESRGTSEPVHRNYDAMDSLLLRVLIVRLRIWLVKRKLNLAGWLETRQPR